MERLPKKEIEQFGIRYHQDITEDLKNLSRNEARSILLHIERALTQYPYLAGEQVKGKNSALRRIKHARYRILFTVVGPRKEVWILAIEHRKQVYRSENLETLIRIAIEIHRSRR